MARRQSNRNTSSLLLFSADMTEGWRVIKSVSYAYGEHRCKLGEFKRLYDGFGRVIGYQPEAAKNDATRPSDPSRAALGAAEMKANAGLMGRSRTRGLSGPDREGRVHPKSGRLLPAEDFIERTQELVRLYPQSANRGGDRAVRVYPKEPPPRHGART